MSKSPINWLVVDRAAESIGISKESRKKWRQRNHVPHKWRLPLIAKTGGVLSVQDFIKLDQRNRRRG
jgi:hypothetical protein